MSDSRREGGQLSPWTPVWAGTIEDPDTVLQGAQSGFSVEAEGRACRAAGVEP